MKKLKNEKGAITLIVLVSILFMVSFLISSYVIVANKVKTQKEMVEQTRAIYDNTENIEEIYNSYFANGVIPIYTVEQLLAIGTEKSVTINGKYYTFLNNDSTIYMLMNDLEFNAYDYGNDYYWTPISDRQDLLSGFHGNKHKIEVKYKDSDGDEYSVIYSEENNFSEPEYKVKVSPRILSETGDILSDATIYTSTNHAEFVAQEEKGEIEIPVKRLVTTKIYAGCEGYRNSGTATITIENPNKIREINLVLGNYSFTINATPEDAKVTINGVERTTISVKKGDEVNWKVEAKNHTTQEGTQIIEEDTVLDVSLNIIKYTIAIEPLPNDATVTISSNGEILVSGEGKQSVEAVVGTPIEYSVNRKYYYSKEGTTTANSDSTISVELESKPEQTLELVPNSVSTTDDSEYYFIEDGLNSESNTSDYAYTYSSKVEYIWNFDTSNIGEDVKITSIVAKYRLGVSVSSKATVTLKAGDTICFSDTTDNITLALKGEEFESSAVTLPTGAEAKSSLTLSAKKANVNTAYLRMYGASLIIKYIEP